MVSDPTGNSKSHNWEKLFRCQGWGEQQVWQVRLHLDERQLSTPSSPRTLIRGPGRQARLAHVALDIRLRGCDEDGGTGNAVRCASLLRGAIVYNTPPLVHVWLDQAILDHALGDLDGVQGSPFAQVI